MLLPIVSERRAARRVRVLVLFYSEWSCPGRTWAAEVLRLHSPNALPYCAAGMDPRVGCGSTDLEESVRGLKL